MIDDRRRSLVFDVIGRIAWLTDRLKDERGLSEGEEKCEAVGSDVSRFSGDGWGEESEANCTDVERFGDCTCCSLEASSRAGRPESSRLYGQRMIV